MSDDLVGLTERTKRNIKGVDPCLVAVILAAVREWQSKGGAVEVIEGLRSLQRQRQLYAVGKSQTLKSKHIEGRAVDVLVNRGWVFADYRAFADVVKRKAAEAGVRVTWGGDWKTFKDGPHFQIEN